MSTIFGSPDFEGCEPFFASLFVAVPNSTIENDRKNLQALGRFKFMVTCSKRGKKSVLQSIAMDSGINR
jgi:hypothetical protein